MMKATFALVLLLLYLTQPDGGRWVRPDVHPRHCGRGRAFQQTPLPSHRWVNQRKSLLMEVLRQTLKGLGHEMNIFKTD